ncbi:ssDNA-binding protein [Pseudomonas phage Stalingrad]|uniref:Single-stranded DNA-binding protein n=1 Tax=Pseudomonas phage Stalingrad TaxID=2762287 RepID=A0A7G8LJ65_9CAUD|nr:ssDNA-binding protein [Pseudomonas phage Stalingrad]
MAAKKVLYTTPIGIAAPYASLQKPDFGSADFPQPRGEYKVNLIVPMDKAAPLMAKLQKIADDSYAEMLAEHKANPPKAQPGKKPVQPRQGDMPWFEDGNGNVVFKFKCYASYEKDGEKRDINIKVADSRGKKIEVVPNISGGSELKVRFSVFPYKWNPTVGASVKLQLDGVMLIKLVEFGGGDDDWGDEVVEGGYEDESYDREGFDQGHDDDDGSDDGAPTQDCDF